MRGGEGWTTLRAVLKIVVKKLLGPGFLFSLSLACVGAQTGTNVSVKAESENRKVLLESLYSSLTAKEEELARLEEQLKNASNETTKQATSENLQNSAAEFLKLRRRFEEAVAGVDISLFVEEKQEAFSWEEQVGDVLKPILSELEDATAESRKIAELRKAREKYALQAEAAADAVEQVRSSLEASLTEDLKTTLEAQLAVWEQRESVASNQVEAANLQLREILSKQESIVESSKKFFRGFVSSRGLSLLYGAIAFLLVFVGIRSMFFAWQRSFQRKRSLTLNDRIVNLAAKGAAIFGGLLAVMAVFNLRSDWFLLSVVLVFLIGLAWLVVKALPHYVQAVNFVLNLGPVREGEILEYHGALWVVESVGFKTYLVNDRLEGGRLRVPYARLLDELSRPQGESELLFPTSKGDWILIGGDLAQTVTQTPSQVIVELEGGARVSHLVADFVGAAPINLSGGFRIKAVFGVDYAHQSLATSAIPEAMTAALKKQLPAHTPEQSLRDVTTLFSGAADSALELEVRLDLGGEAAGQYTILKAAIQRILVDLCTEKGWGIPFPHLTVNTLAGSGDRD